MDNLIGKKLDGRYLIESLIGVGGMANVYKGCDVRTGNQIAVKGLKSFLITKSWSAASRTNPKLSRF